VPKIKWKNWIKIKQKFKEIEDWTVHYFNEISLSMGKDQHSSLYTSTPFFLYSLFLLTVCVCIRFSSSSPPKAISQSYKSHLRHWQHHRNPHLIIFSLVCFPYRSAGLLRNMLAAHWETLNYTSLVDSV
jgi:hypothetical protein